MTLYKLPQRQSVGSSAVAGMYYKELRIPSTGMLRVIEIHFVNQAPSGKLVCANKVSAKVAGLNGVIAEIRMSLNKASAWKSAASHVAGKNCSSAYRFGVVS